MHLIFRLSLARFLHFLNNVSQSRKAAKHKGSIAAIMKAGYDKRQWRKADSSGKIFHAVTVAAPLNIKIA